MTDGSGGATSVDQQERLRRWRLILGSTSEPAVEPGPSPATPDPSQDLPPRPGEGPPVGGRRPGATELPLDGPDVRLDAALGAVYDRAPATPAASPAPPARALSLIHI